MSRSDIIFNTTPQGAVRVQIFVEQGTFWLTRIEVAEHLKDPGLN